MNEPKAQLKVDPARIDLMLWMHTAIYVRAQLPDGSWTNADIVQLDRASLLLWLHSRGDCNPWAENVVGLLLGHEHFHDGGPHCVSDEWARQWEMRRRDVIERLDKLAGRSRENE